MSFNPDDLPPTTYDSYQKNGAIGWIITVRFAILEGVRDPNYLANIPFYLHHPELKGRPIYNEEIKLIAEWKAFRTLIRALRKGLVIKEKTKNPFDDIKISSFQGDTSFTDAFLEAQFRESAIESFRRNFAP